MLKSLLGLFLILCIIVLVNATSRLTVDEWQVIDPRFDLTSAENVDALRAYHKSEWKRAPLLKKNLNILDIAQCKRKLIFESNALMAEQPSRLTAAEWRHVSAHLTLTSPENINALQEYYLAIIEGRNNHQTSNEEKMWAKKQIIISQRKLSAELGALMAEQPARLTATEWARINPLFALETSENSKKLKEFYLETIKVNIEATPDDIINAKKLMIVTERMLSIEHQALIASTMPYFYGAVNDMPEQYYQTLFLQYDVLIDAEEPLKRALMLEPFRPQVVINLLNIPQEINLTFDKTDLANFYEKITAYSLLLEVVLHDSRVKFDQEDKVALVKAWAANGNAQSLQTLLNFPRFNFNLSDKNLVFDSWSKNRHPEALHVMLDHAGLDFGDDDKTRLLAACRGVSALSILNLLFSNPKLTFDSSDKYNLLAIWESTESLQVLRFLLTQPALDLNVGDTRHLLNFAAKSSKSLDILNLLANSAVNIDERHKKQLLTAWSNTLDPYLLASLLAHPRLNIDYRDKPMLFEALQKSSSEKMQLLSMLRRIIGALFRVIQHTPLRIFNRDMMAWFRASRAVSSHHHIPSANSPHNMCDIEEAFIPESLTTRVTVGGEIQLQVPGSRRNQWHVIASWKNGVPIHNRLEDMGYFSVRKNGKYGDGYYGYTNTPTALAAYHRWMTSVLNWVDPNDIRFNGRNPWEGLPPQYNRCAPDSQLGSSEIDLIRATIQVLMAHRDQLGISSDDLCALTKQFQSNDFIVKILATQSDFDLEYAKSLDHQCATVQDLVKQQQARQIAHNQEQLRQRIRNRNI